MSRKSILKQLGKTLKRGVYRFVDDRSGFYAYSDNMRVDHLGRVTTPDNWDPIHPSEMNIKFPVEKPVAGPKRPEPDPSLVSNEGDV